MDQTGIESISPQKGLIHWVLDMVYPQKCVLCGVLLGEEAGPLCPRCADDLPRTDVGSCRQFGRAFSVCLSPLYYQGELRQSFRRYKFKGRWQYSRVYSRWMIEGLARWEPHWTFDLVTWVPLNWVRLSKRGYDQTRLLAAPVARYLGLPLTPTLRKGKNIMPQSHLKAAGQRWENVKGSFQVRTGAEVAGRRILLIDDLITTGATLEEAASALMEAGAEEVCCLTLARSGAGEDLTGPSVAAGAGRRSWR